MKTRMIVAAVATVMALVSVGADERYANEAELPRIDALALKSEGCLLYGQVLVPSSRLTSYFE